MVTVHDLMKCDMNSKKIFAKTCEIEVFSFKF